jgi:hypothetical protein
VGRQALTRLFAIGAALTALLFPDVVFGGRTFVGRDVQLVYIPLREFFIAHGPLAGWYPYDALGQSWLGMLISGALHPMQWLNWPLGAVQALKWTTLLSFPFAFAGAATLARRVSRAPGASEVAGAAYAFSGYLVSMTDNPLYLVGAATLPWAVELALRYGDAPGGPRLLLAGAVTASIVYAGDAMTFGIALAGIVLATRRVELAAVALGLSAPQLFPVLLTSRDAAQAHQTLAQAEVWSLEPWRLLEFFGGPIFSFPVGEGDHPLWAKSVFIGAPVLMLALGGLKRVWAAAAAALLLLALGKYTPFYAALYWVVPGLRYPEKLLPGFVLLVSLAAARGFSEKLRWPVLLVGLAAVAAPTAHAWWCLPLAALSLLTLRWRVLAVLPVLLAARAALTPGDPQWLHAPAPQVDKSWRVMTQVSGFSIPEGVPPAEGFARAAAKGFQPVTPALYGYAESNTYLPAATLAVTELKKQPDYLAQSSTRFVAVSRDGEIVIEEHPEALPRFNAKVLADELTHQSFEAQGTLIVRDALARGWTATVDGQPAAFENHALRVLTLPPGTHHVDLDYETPGLRWGALAAALAAALSFLRRAQPRPAAEPSSSAAAPASPTARP